MLVIVTGGSAGIGRAFLEAAPPDARLVNVSRSASGLEGVFDEEADLSTRAGLTWAEAVVRREVAGFDGDRVVLLHAAGTVHPIGFAGEVDSAAYTDLVVLDAVAPQVVGHAFLAAVGSHPATRRAFVQLSSGAASTPYEGWSGYNAGKAAGDQWVRTAGAEQARRAEEVGRDPVTVLAVAPGVVATDMQAQIRDMDERDFPNVERFRELYADGDLLDPADVADRLWSLLAAGIETGSVLDVRDLPTEVEART